MKFREVSQSVKRLPKNKAKFYPMLLCKGRGPKMKVFHRCFGLLLGGVFLLSGVTMAATPKLGVIQPGEYPLQVINHHTPGAFKSSEAYWDSLQQVDLEVGKTFQFRDLPKLGMKNPYTGYITLGDASQKFGVIVDIYGEEKRLYIDTDGDGSFAGEPMTILLNEWQGLQIYWVTAPEPLSLKVKYSSGNIHPISITVYGLLNQSGALAKEKPYLKVQVRTWFLAQLVEDSVAKSGAIVDLNNNGRYNDPEDQLLIDYNDNGYFSDEEVVNRKKGLQVKNSKKSLTVDWSVYPAKIVLGGKSQ